MTVTELKNQIKLGPCGAYLFYGEEGYLKRYYLNSLRKAVLPDPDAAAFNHIILRADETEISFGSLEAAFSAIPMMSEKKLVEIHGIDFNKITSSQKEDLISALESLDRLSFNVVVIFTEEDEISVGTAKKPSAIFKSLAAVTKPVQFGYEAPERLKRWILQHFAANGIEASPELCSKLLSYCGSDMYLLSSEIDKLSFFTASQERKEARISDIEKVCAKSRTIGEFDFSNAIRERDTEYALYILSDMKARKERPEIILGTISKTYSDMCILKSLSACGMSLKDISAKLKMNEYRAGLYLKSVSELKLCDLEQAVGICLEADRKIKSSSIDSYYVLKTLICSLSLLF